MVEVLLPVNPVWPIAWQRRVRRSANLQEKRGKSIEFAIDRLAWAHDLHRSEGFTLSAVRRRFFMTRHLVYLTAALALCWPSLGFAQDSNAAAPGGATPSSGAKSPAPTLPQPAPAGQINSPANNAGAAAPSGQPQAQPAVPGGQVQGQVGVQGGTAPPAQQGGAVQGQVTTPGGANVPGNVAASGPVQDNQWRYRWHNGRWWYWTPANNWVVYLNNAWRPYTPGMFDSGYFGTSNSGTYYTPYSGYRYYSPYGYSYRSYPYYGNYGYGYGPSIGLNFGTPRHYSGYRGFGGYNGYGNRGGVSIGIGGGFY